MTQFILKIKGTVRVTSSDPPCRDDNARFTKLYLINNVGDIVVFLVGKVLKSDEFYIFFCSRYVQVTFIENPQMKIIIFKIYEH